MTEEITAKVPELTLKQLPEILVNQEMLQQLKAQSAVLEAPVTPKQIVKDFILITYDIPNTEDGVKMRLWFLKEARCLGAVAHSESVYFLPWTHESNVAAVLLSKVAKSKVFVWYTNTNEDMAKDLLVQYDRTINKWIDELDEDLEKIDGHILNLQYKLAYRMLDRRLKTLSELETVVKNRGSEAMMEGLVKMKVYIGSLVDRLLPNMK